MSIISRIVEEPPFRLASYFFVKRFAHSVDTITCTSEMSGTASSGVTRRAQRPQNPKMFATMNTSARLRAHQAMMRSIIAHPECR